MRATVDETIRFVEVPELSGARLPEPGKPFGPYAVEVPVGQGGMGAVYRARDPKLGRAIALKVMLPAEAEDPESRARFVREARLAAALEHPAIVRIYEVGEIEGTPYIAMEWIEGRTLRAAKPANPIAVLERIAETLAYAHDRGVVHRDLKPANVMLDAHESPKLVDFGIAKRVGGPSTFATRDGTVLGTPRYMAPEQELSSAVDARADQYAWGVIAYELLTGEKPARPALAHAALDERHGPIVMRALSVAPADRFASMHDLLAAWRPPARPREEPRRAAPTQPPRKVGRTALFVATVAAVTGVGLVVALFMWRPRSSAQPSPPPTKVEPPVSTAEDAAPEPAPSPSASLSASASAMASAKPAPTQTMPTVRSLGAITIDGSGDLDREELFARLREVRPALQRCVVDLSLPSYLTRDQIASDVYFRVKEVDVHVLEVSYAAAQTRGTERRHDQFPPMSTAACITAILKKIEITRPKEDSLSYARIILELRK